MLERLDGQADHAAGISRQLDSQAEAVKDIRLQLFIQDARRDALVHGFESVAQGQEALEETVKRNASALLAVPKNITDLAGRITELTVQLANAQHAIKVNSRASEVQRVKLAGLQVELHETTRQLSQKSTRPADSRYPRFGATDKEDPFDWIEAVTALQVACGIPAEVLCSKLPLMLKNEAASWYERLAAGSHKARTWDEWIEAFNTRFNRSTWEKRRKSQLKAMLFGGTHGAADHVERFAKLHRRITGATERETIVALCATLFKHGGIRRGVQQHLERDVLTLNGFIPRLKRLAKKHGNEEYSSPEWRRTGGPTFSDAMFGF